MSNITMLPCLQEPPVLSAQVSSFTLREKPAVETRNLSRKNRILSQARCHQNFNKFKTLEVTRNNLDVKD